MLRFLLAPRWLLLHLVTVAAIAGSIVLGSWQMQAYAEQDERERVAAANLQADAPRQPLADVVPVGQALPVDAVSVPVEATGTYDSENTLLLPGRELDGRSGYVVVTPLVADDGTVTPVLRGWVDDPSTPSVAAPRGVVEIEGSVQALETDAAAAVDPTLALPQGQLPALTSVALFSTWPYPPADLRQAQVVLTAEQPSTAAPPVLVPPVDAAPPPVGVSAWRHLSYAWQWWLFAVAAVVFWGAFVRAGIREQREQQDAPGHAGHEPDRPPQESSHQGLA